MDTDREMQRAIAIGEANKRVLELAQNWCAHLRVELRGGVGLVEQMTGLPIGMRAIVCSHARAAGFAAMDLEMLRWIFMRGIVSGVQSVALFDCPTSFNWSTSATGSDSVGKRLWRGRARPN